MNVVIILAAAILVIDSRLRTAVVAYVIFTLGTLWLSHPHGADTTIAGIAVFSILAFIKVVIGPAALLWLRRKYRVPDDLAPSVNLGGRIAVVALALFFAHMFAGMPAFSDVTAGSVVLYCIFASICIVILHRNLLAHVIGLLALGSAVTLAAAVFAPSLPGAVELADTFDAVIATLIAIAMARAIIVHDPRLDIRSLRELRG
jgi:hydrogenase-4 membrane subunit HyfE